MPVRALMDGVKPWDPFTPDQVQIQVSSDQAINNISTLDPAALVGNRVYLGAWLTIAASRSVSTA